ncbi:hypothetical protein BDV33DRAFT_210788 [Aspergillus novoparasiticus]|uniref:Protein kinase domain-containing protein n=1 Tax=Aspergillus novoparasiticus TaxID=986946 RepID=A0A5N6E5K4_9EURO|nr:hypothetical protein BDV33DRAFT_210788 [Aspergillus novoparasiticus]
MDDRPLTQLCAESFQAKRPMPKSVSAQESQGQVNYKPTKRTKQWEKQEDSKNILLGYAQDVPQSSSQGVGQVAQSPVIRRRSPWDTLKDLFTCDLAGPVSIAVHEKDPSRVIAVRAFSKKKADIWLQVLQQTHHPNVISANEIFKDHGMTYFIVDDLPLTLEHLVACDIFPSELQLASILAQVLNGLSHLLENGFEHQSLTCSNILLGQDGTIQIGALEHCIEREPQQSQTQILRSLANITMFLMQKYLKPDGVIGIDGTRWQSDSLEFLSATASVATIQDLRKHSILTKHRWSAGTLVGLARLCLITTRTFITKPWIQN